MAFFDINPLLESMLDVSPSVSDLNLSVGRPPQVEIDGTLQSVSFGGVERLLPYHTEVIAMRLMRSKRELIERLVQKGSVDLSYSLPKRTRFRVNVFSQRGTYCVVLRVIPNKIPTVEELSLPTQLNEITNERNGIVLVTGPTGSGKSTTLAAIIGKMNRELPIHIVTIEDPIEYLHLHNKATINQREVGTDTSSFADALRAALRQAPKVILVGEMRDRETVTTALEASETGHLVLSTLHTIDATKTIDRIIGVFPKNEERQVRNRFAQSFKWVVSQRLIPKKEGGRFAACEILRATSRTREYIREGERDGKTLLDAINDSSLDGMQSFDSELERLIREGVVDAETGLSYATNRTNLQLKLGLDSSIAGGDEESAESKDSDPAAVETDETDLNQLIER
jgi:twitching motility protein PilT